MRTIFMGTPEFAVIPLEMLIKAKTNIVAVVTQPDRPVGRKRKITPPPVKTLSRRYDIPVYQPPKIKTADFIDTLISLKPKLIIVVAYGQILSRQILEIPRIGCINVHASLLPKYRGASPIQWAIINGEETTGVTTMWMDEGLDTGDIFLQKQIAIKPNWSALDLSKKLSRLGGDLLLKTLSCIKSGNLIRKRQDNKKSTYAPMLKREDGLIDWSKSAYEICNLIRGTYPWPGAYTFKDGRRLKILEAKPYLSKKAHAPGKFMGIVKNKGFLVGTGDGSVLVIKLQRAGGRRMKAMEYLAGHNMKEGDSFANIPPK